ncbi:MAG: MoaD/ThiS family protein [Candidatus Njordarchaeia archaeon]
MVDKINVKVKYYAIFREISSKRTEIIAIRKGSTVRNLIGEIDKKYGGKIAKLLLDSKGELKDNYIILLNGVNVNNLNGLETIIDKNSGVVIFPPFSGG